jgi:hypothetical protein
MFTMKGTTAHATPLGVAACIRAPDCNLGDSKCRVRAARYLHRVSGK